MPEELSDNLRTVAQAIQDDLKATSEEDRQAYFMKLKISSTLIMIGVSQDAMEGWDGKGDFPLSRIPENDRKAFLAWTQSDSFKDDSVARLLMGGPEALKRSLPDD